MTVERCLRLAAGALTLVSLLLAQLVSPWFLLLTAFVGLNLLQSGFSNWCPLMSILRGLHIQEGPSRGDFPRRPESRRFSKNDGKLASPFTRPAS